MKINGIEVKGKLFAYDGCHKFYIIEDYEDVIDAVNVGYSLYPISEIKSKWEKSCDLKFIHNKKLTVDYVKQFEQAIFEH